jgi:uncharacterized Rossmann fold enzyme
MSRNTVLELDKNPPLVQYPLIKYFTRDPIFIIRINQGAPSILKYVSDAQNELGWFILKHQTRGKTQDIRLYKNIHRGQRCFIIGNGPSVNKTNFRLIRNEINFGTNLLYEALEKLGIKCTYYVMFNKYLMSIYFDNFCNLDLPFFIGQHAAEEYAQQIKKTNKEFKQKPVVIRYKRELMWAGKEMSTDLHKGSSDGDSVVISGLQIAYYMGFTKVYLLGCDCDFGIQGHFYTGTTKGDEDEQNVSVPRWMKSYRMCKKAYEADGREIINATVGGKLEVFKRQSLEEIIGRDVK